MTQLFLSPSGHFEVIKEDIVCLEDMNLVNILRANNPVIAEIASFYIPETSTP